MTPSKPEPTDRRVTLAWGAALVALVVWAIWRVGGFDLTTTLESGRTVPNMYGTVDHPFHAARAATLLQSLRDGELLRWIGSHQGGYPVEYYPLGVPWIDVILWALFIGSVPILAIHKLAVAIILVLPALAYWLLVRGDRLHPSAAFLATAFHLAIPGYWLSGGYEELVGWGLVTNVAGATFALISTILLARYVLGREHWAGVFAVLSIAAGTVCNPRSLFGVVIATIAIAVWSLATSRETSWRRRVIDTVTSVGIVGGLAFTIAAPVVLALMRYNGNYFFLHYQFYQPLSMFWDALKMALSFPILILAIIGAVGVFMARVVGRPRVSQAIAIAAGLYSLLTIWVAKTSNPPPLVEQLEAPRLMPYQRLLLLALAAVIVVLVLARLAERLSFIWREALIAVVVLAISIGSLWSMTHRDAELPLNESALYPVSTTGDARFAGFEDAISLANDLRADGSAIFVVGNQHEWWHEQLWAPGIADGTYYYDDWLWYWHRDQLGPYDEAAGYYMLQPDQALTAEYFAEHAIGVVVVSDMWVPNGLSPVTAAAESDLLEYQGTFGAWSIYTVRETGSIATRGDDVPTEIAWSNQRIEATFADGSGDIVVRQNWFPRWTATVNGEPATITRTETGYMQIAVPNGEVDLVLEYGVTGLDWVARGLSVAGIAGVAVFAWRGRALRPHAEEEVSDVA